MSEKDKSIPKVFILESLAFDDEENDRFEGDIIYQILKMSSVHCEYHYFRTKQEFEYFIEKFKESNFRYLHLSCHASKEGITTTLNDCISIDELTLLLENVLDKRRLFLSACSLTNDKLANSIFNNTECYSIMGADQNISMNDSVIFWASFYHLMFNREKGYIIHEEIKDIVYRLRQSFKIPLRYYRISSKTKQGWRKVTLKD